MKGPMQEKSVVRFEIAPRSIALILATLVAVWLFFQLRVLVLLVVVALVLAGTFNPLVEWSERHGLRRIYGLILLFCGLLGITCLLIFFMVPPLAEQLAQIVGDLPRHREQLIALLQQRDFTAPLARAVQHAGLEVTLARIENYLVGYTPRAALGLGTPRPRWSWRFTSLRTASVPWVHYTPSSRVTTTCGWRASFTTSK